MVSFDCRLIERKYTEINTHIQEEDATYFNAMKYIQYIDQQAQPKLVTRVLFIM